MKKWFAEDYAFTITVTGFCTAIKLKIIVETEKKSVMCIIAPMDAL